MRSKKYKLCETAEETANKNNLVFPFSTHEKNIFNLSLLDNSEISEREKAYIKNYIFKCEHCHFKEVSFIYDDKFYNGDLLRCRGSFDFKVQRITPEKDENRYYVFTLVKIEYTAYKKSGMIVYNYEDDWINEYNIYKCEGKWKTELEEIK